MENHPDNIKHRWKGLIVATLIFLTVSTMIGLQFTGRNLINSEAPSGIVSYELARNEIASQAILDSWDQQAKTYAAFNLGLDYLFLFLYPATIALVVLRLAELVALGGIATKLANITAASMVIAGFLDAVENSALLYMLVNSAQSPFPQLAYVSAIVKFLLVGIGLLVIIALLGKLIIRKPR